jgi:hypothetical protein
VTLRLPFGGAMVLACTPEAVRQILVSGNDAFARASAARAMCPAISGTVRGVKAGARTRRCWRQVSPSASTRHAEMQRLSLDIAATAMFSLEADAFGPRLRAMVSGYLVEPRRTGVGGAGDVPGHQRHGPGREGRGEDATLLCR